MFLDAFDDLMLGYALKKLTDVFEEIEEVSKNTASDKATSVSYTHLTLPTNREV